MTESELCSAITNDGNETAFGLGWRLGEINGLRSIGHSGSINGFTTQIHRFIEQSYTVIVLVNNPCLFSGALVAQISEIYLLDQVTLHSYGTCL